jgi:threonine aldolase
MDTLAREVGFDFWMALDDHHTVVRFATSWATTPEQVEALRELL